MSLALAAALLAPAPPAESPRAFVERLYAGYRDSAYDPFEDPGLIFAPPLVAAIREDQRLSSDEVGYLDGDPLCQCQDSSELKSRIGEVRRQGRSATAHVLLSLGGADRRDLRLRLVRSAAGWRIADVSTADEPSLLRSLNRFNRRRSRR